jgi:hypothetical protein
LFHIMFCLMCGLLLYFEILLGFRRRKNVASLKCSTLWLRDCKNCCVCCCRLHYFTGSSTDLHTWPAVDYKSCCFCFCLQLLGTLNPIVNWNPDITVQETKREHTLKPMVNWNLDSTIQEAKREWSSEQHPPSITTSTHSNWNNFYLWNWICAIYWGLGVGGEPKEDIP